MGLLLSGKEHIDEVRYTLREIECCVTTMAPSFSSTGEDGSGSGLCVTKSAFALRRKRQGNLHESSDDSPGGGEVRVLHALQENL